MNKADYETLVDTEFLVLKGDRYFISINKYGGGTMGKEYLGNWQVTIYDRIRECMIDRDLDFYTGIPKTHYQVADIVYEIITAEC